MVVTHLPGLRNSGMGTPVMRLRYVSVLVASGAAIGALTGCGSSSSGSPQGAATVPPADSGNPVNVSYNAGP